MTTILRLIKIYSEKMPQCIVLSWTFFAIISEGTFLQDFLLRVQQEFFQRFPRELFYNYIYFFRFSFFTEFLRTISIRMFSYIFPSILLECIFILVNISLKISQKIPPDYFFRNSYGNFPMVFFRSFVAFLLGFFQGLYRKVLQGLQHKFLYVFLYVFS